MKLTCSLGLTSCKPKLILEKYTSRKVSETGIFLKSSCLVTVALKSTGFSCTPFH